MTRWYRAYSGTVSDPKVAEVALIAECSRSVAISAWHAILESAADAQDGGHFETSSRRIAATLCEPIATVDRVLAALAEVGLIRDAVVVAWQRRQYESDTSTERSRKHRERKRNTCATLHDRCATPPETETETEADTSSLRSEGATAPADLGLTEGHSRPPAEGVVLADTPPPPTYTDPVHELFGEGVPTLVSLGVAEKQARSMIGKWRRDASEDCQAVLAAIVAAREQRVTDPVPWITAALKTRTSPNDRNRPRRPSATDNLIAGFAAVAARYDRGGDLHDAAGEAPIPADAHAGPTIDLEARRGGDPRDDAPWPDAGDYRGGGASARRLPGH